MSNQSAPNDSTPIIALIIAGYGAVVSTILGINELRKSRRALRVTCRLAESLPVIIYSYVDRLEPREANKVFELEVTALNNGPRPIQITKVGLKMSDDHLFTSRYGEALPKKLEFSDSFGVKFSISEMEKEAKERGKVFTRAVVIDAEDKEYTTKLPKSLKEKKLI